METADSKSDSNAAASETEPRNGTAAAPPPAEPTVTDLFNHQVDLQKIEFLNTRMLHLQSENESLRARHEKREQETREFVAYFQKEIQTRDKQITKLTEELAAAKLSHALELEATLQSKDAAFQQTHSTFASKEESFTEQVFFLKEELNQLEMFLDMKEIIHNKMSALETELQSEKEQAHDKVRDLERKFLEEKACLQKEHEKKIEIVKQQAKEDARNGLDADTRKIVTDNRCIGEELRFQLQMTEELQKEKEHFEVRAKKLGIEVQISKAKEDEYAVQAQRQAREIKQLCANVKDLEKKMTESLAVIEREKYAEVSKTGKDFEDMVLDVDGLRNLRLLVQTILDQRTDVEQFFIDALAYVKQEIETERKKQHDLELERYHMEVKRSQGLLQHASSLRFPKLQAQAQTPAEVLLPAPPKPHFSEKVDLRQLTWDKRERVLRLVFAKINGTQSYADAPMPQDYFHSPSPSSSLSSYDFGASEPSPNQVGGGVYLATEPASPILSK
ncbi:Basal body-orientation factor 1, partial [Globisporangium splendens]